MKKGLQYRLAGAFLRLTGWKLEGEPPPVPKCVVIGAPHTSNFDGVLLVVLSWRWGLGVNWIGKDTLFEPPLGHLMRRLGGIAVDRSAPHGVVGEMTAAMEKRDRVALCITPEGTRGYTDHWKSGFYQIALAAQVPIVLGYVDYPRKRFGFGPLYYPTGDVKKDMDAIRAFYADKEGRFPKEKGEIRLKQEDPTAAG
jgi:1-acyl-sn-glycerol-3-phosphate acyltransferase